MTRKIVLSTLVLIAFYYCFRFGYIWTAYGHGGQLLGVPFAVVMLITTIIFFVTSTKKNKEITFYFGIIYFLTLTAFSITIEIIRANMNDYFQFLYYEPGGYVNKIFLGWLLLGAIIFFMLKQIKNIKKKDTITDKSV